MPELLQSLGQWWGATLLRDSGTAYLLVNATHILGIGLLLGSILPLDLRLIGVLRAPPLALLGPFLSRTAAVGLALAMLTGIWLFSVNPSDYIQNQAFLYKMGLLGFALINVVLQQTSGPYRSALRGGAIHVRVRVLALLSACLWLGMLVAGRWIGFL